jgi:D-alanine-D-alanine ligase
MRIGLTFDLRAEYLEMGFSEEETAEFDSQDTIEKLSAALESLGHEVDRIGNIYELTRRLSLGQKWDLVFNVCEGLLGRSREAQVPALLEAYNIPYTFSDPLTLALSLDKALAKAVVKDAGVPTAKYVLIRSMEEAEDNRDKLNSIGYPLFVKPVSEGTGKGITPASIIRDEKELKNQCKRLLAKYSQPVLVEKYLSGKEYTVGILGTGARARVVGVLEVELLKNAEPLVYSYMNKELCEERVKYTLVRKRRVLTEASEMALRAYKALGCRDAGRIDIKSDGQEGLFFLEANPLAGLNPTHSDLPILCGQAGMDYKELISAILESAAERISKGKEKKSITPFPKC